MPQERTTDTLTLKLIDNREGHLGSSRFDDDIARAACDKWLAAFFRDRDQSDVIYKVEIQKESGFGLAEVAPDRKKSAVEGLGA
jgi:hypothetical protein